MVGRWAAVQLRHLSGTGQDLQLSQLWETLEHGVAQSCIPALGTCVCRACLVFHLAARTIATRWRCCGQSDISWDGFPEQRPCSEETVWFWTAILREHTWLCCLHCDPQGWPTPPLHRDVLSPWSHLAPQAWCLLVQDKVVATRGAQR